MRLYRIAPERHLENYQGLGASYKDGARWNRPGQPVLYFALSPATALLEMGHYLPSPKLTPQDYRLGIYELPDDVQLETVDEHILPEDWAKYPYPDSTQMLGGDWLEKAKALVLLVPSAAVPQGLEKIAVINPQIRDVDKIKLIESTSNLYNDRLFVGI